MHRPKRIVTTDEKIYDAILAELLDLNVSTAATHAYNIVTRIKEHDAPKKISDITGFPEDDDIENEEVDRQAEEYAEEIIKIRRRIPGMPRQL